MCTNTDTSVLLFFSALLEQLVSGLHPVKTGYSWTDCSEGRTLTRLQEMDGMKMHSSEEVWLKFKCT